MVFSPLYLYGKNYVYGKNRARGVKACARKSEAPWKY